MKNGKEAVMKGQRAWDREEDELQLAECQSQTVDMDSRHGSHTCTRSLSIKDF